LVGLAVLAVVAAYLAQPFRPTGGAAVDRKIEAWVKQVGADASGVTEQRQHEPLTGSNEAMETSEVTETINYCPKCGRRVGPDDRFCSGCGMQLRAETE
jgi:hypothetical protein